MIIIFKALVKMASLTKIAKFAVSTRPIDIPSLIMFNSRPEINSKLILWVTIVSRDCFVHFRDAAVAIINL